MVGPSESNKVSYRSTCNLGPMSDQDSERPKPARPPSQARPDGQDRGKQRGGKRDRAGRPSSEDRRRHQRGGPPTPARAPGGSSLSDVVPLEETRLVHDGMEWLVRICGRSGGQRGGAPLLLLGFWPLAQASDGKRGRGEENRPSNAPAPVDAKPEREVLTVGTSLDEFGYEDLRAAFVASQPPPEPPRPRTEERPARRPRRRGRGRR